MFQPLIKARESVLEIDLARRSPGEVLLRQRLPAATEERAHTFDFGLGEEAFKGGSATPVKKVRTLSLYPPASLTKKQTKRGRDL